LLNDPTLNESLIIRKTGGATLETFTIYLDNSLLLAPSNFKTTSGLGTGQVKYFVSEPTNNLYEGLFAEGGSSAQEIGGIANAYEPALGKPWETEGSQGTVTAPRGWLSRDFTNSNFGSTGNYVNPAINYTTESPVGNVLYTLIFKRSTPDSNSSLQIQGLQNSDAPIGTSPLENGDKIEFKFEDIYLLPSMSGGSDGSGVLNPPYEPVNSAYANPLTDFNNLLRLVDLYEPTAFDTNTRTWKEILTGPLGTNNYLGNWTSTVAPTVLIDIEPQAIF
jgi:hypothetical protein